MPAAVGSTVRPDGAPEVDVVGVVFVDVVAVAFAVLVAFASAVLVATALVVFFSTRKTANEMAAQATMSTRAMMPRIKPSLLRRLGGCWGVPYIPPCCGGGTT